MAIPSAETRALKEEIRADLFKQAFIQLAVEFRRRDRKGFEGAALSVRRKLENLSVKRIVPPAAVQAGAIDLKLLQERGLSDALTSYDDAIHQLRHRLG